MMATAFRASVAFAALFIASVSAVMIGLAILESPWLTYPEQPFPVLEEPVKAGEVVRLSVVRCNAYHLPRSYLFSHTLVSLEGRADVVLDAELATIRPGCSVVESRVNTIPPTTRPGRYRIEGTTEVNGMVRTWSVAWVSASFEVVP